MEFHVDYREPLGWQEPFSHARYSQRQRAYGKLFALNNIYTLQAIIASSTEDNLNIALVQLQAQSRVKRGAHLR